MGYYISTWGELTVDPHITGGHSKLFNHFSKKLCEFGGAWKVSQDKIAWEDDISKSHPDDEILKKLVQAYLIPWGYTVNGVVFWDGESEGDYGCIVVRNNHVQLRYQVGEYDLYCENHKR